MTKRQVSELERRNARRSWRDEGGSILIPVAVALLGLLAFSAFTIDNGVMLSSRRQAQNAADSAALAAALYLAWDAPNDQAGAQATAVAAAQQHSVWGNQPDVTLADVTFPACPPGAPGLADVCVRVDVFRNQRAGGDPLPAFFAMLAGVTDQGVQATATAQVLYGTGAFDCLLPFAIPDRWLEVRETWDTDPGIPPGDAIDDSNAPLVYPYDSRNAFGLDATFELWDPDDTMDVVRQVGQQGGPPLWPAQQVDLYQEGAWQPWSTPNYGDPDTQDPTGYNPAFDHGLQVVVKAANGSQISPSNYFPVVIPDGLGNGASAYRGRIEGCTGSYPSVEPGVQLVQETGNMVGPTAQGVNHLRGLDGALWDDAAGFGTVCANHDCSMMVPREGYFTGSCAQAPNTGCPGGWGMQSPLHRPLAVFDPRNFMEGHRTGRGEVLVTGIIGVFLEPMQGNDVVIRITDIDVDPSASGTTDDRSSFLRSVILVR